MNLFASGVGPLPENEFPYRGNNHLLASEDKVRNVNALIPDNAPKYGLDPDVSVEEFIETVKKKEGLSSTEEVYNWLFKRLFPDDEYSHFDDWTIPETDESGNSNRLLSAGFVLKEGNQLPPYWSDDEKREIVSEEAVNAMKQEMMNGHGVNLNYYADDVGVYTNSDEEHGKEFAQYAFEKKEPDHGVCVIGWDDSYAKENFTHKKDSSGKPVSPEASTPPADGAWIVKNSWGSASDAAEDDLGNVVNRSDYGLKNKEGKNTGYFYLSYYDKSIGTCETMSFSTNLSGNDYFEVYQHDYLPAATDSLEYSLPKVMSAANVFTAQEDENLISISVGTEKANTRVEYAVFLLEEDAVSPVDGVMVCKASENMRYAGIHRIDLDLEIPLKKGQGFSVITTTSSLDNEGKRVYSICANRAYSEKGYEKYKKKLPWLRCYGNAVVNPGESFLFKDETWKDWSSSVSEISADSEDFATDNFSIKAYVVPAKKTNLNAPKITGVKDQTWTGKQITQDSTVMLNGEVLREGIDYELSYKNNVDVGTAKLIVNGIGSYSGTAQKTFAINPKGTTISALTPVSKGFTASWKKQTSQTTGYQLQYSLDKKFKSGNKTVNIGRNRTAAKKVTGLKSKKTYYVRVRTFKSADGKKYYSAWSAQTKKVTAG